jgi:hypothetical protein
MKNTFTLWALILVVSTAGVASIITQRYMGITQIVNNQKNEVALNAQSRSEMKTTTISRQEIEIVVKDLTKNIEKAQTTAAVAQVQAAQTQGSMVALSPIISSPALQETLKTLASSPEAVSALNNVAVAVEKAKEGGDEGKTVELLTRLDNVESNIKKLEDFKIEDLIAKIESLKASVPTTEVLDANLKTLNDLLTKQGNEAIAKEISALSNKFNEQITNEKQPLQVQITAANNSILNIQSGMSILTQKDTDFLEQISNIHDDIGGITTNMSDISKQVIPIGGTLCIADWLGATIESNFVRADGQVISNPLSPLNGNTMPDINIAKLYLR